MMVSEEPMRMEAQRPAKLSGPSIEKRLLIIAVAALPEIGRIRMTGITESGIPSLRVNMPMPSQIASNAPLAENMRVAHISITRLGKSFTQV